MVKFSGIHIALIVLVVAVIIYLIFKIQKKDDKKEEGNFEKLLSSQKETQYIVPSRYEEGNNKQERIVDFPKQKTNDIANEWIQKFVKDYCGKTTDFKFPTNINDKFRRTTNVGQFFTILSSNKTEEQKKDDLGMLFVIIGMIEKKSKYRVLYNDRVELAEETAAFLDIASNVSFKDFKDAIYNVMVDIHDGSDAAKARYRERRKRLEQNKKSRDPSYELSNDQKIDEMYISERNGYINSAQVYCQNI
jgi:hypothetical protein